VRIAPCPYQVTEQRLLLMNEFVGYPEILTLANRSVDTLRSLMRAGRFPRPTYRRGTKKFWLRSEVEDALARLALPVPLTVPPAESNAAVSH